MTKKIIIEADSVEETREKAESQLPKGFEISSEKIMEGKPVSIQAIGKTVKEAFAKLENKIPSDVKIIERKKLRRSGERTVELEAWNEENAISLIKAKIKDLERLKKIEMLKKGSKGFFGFNKKLSLFRATISRKAKVELTYKREKFKVQYSFKPKSMNEAIRKGDITEVKMIIESTKASVKSKYKAYPLLMTAAGCGHKDIVELLLSKGANVNASTSWGSTALSVAARDGETNMVEFLLSNGANVNSKEYDGYTALSRAAMNGHTQIVKILLSKGANVNIQTKHGHTALTLAKQNHHNKVAALLRK